jgi:hypothetical protein
MEAGRNRHRCSKCSSQEVGDHHLHKVNNIIVGEDRMPLNSKLTPGQHNLLGSKLTPGQHNLLGSNNPPGVPKTLQRSKQQRALGAIRLGMLAPLARSRMAGISSKGLLGKLGPCRGVQPLMQDNPHNNMALPQHRAGANQLTVQDNQHQRLTPGELLLLLHNTIPAWAFQLLLLPLLDGSRQVWGKQEQLRDNHNRMLRLCMATTMIEPCCGLLICRPD